MGRFKRSAVMAVGFVGIFVGSARAQERLVATIPFPFVVRGVELPAGRYDIVDVDGVITIEGTASHSAAVAMATPASGQDPEGREPSLVFIHSEGRYTLSQIWESDAKGLALTGRTGGGRHVGALRASEPLAVVSAEGAK